MDKLLQTAPIAFHPKLVEKWARRYIKMYRKDGAEVAKKWAVEFLPPPALEAMSEKVNLMLHKKKPNGK